MANYAVHQLVIEVNTTPLATATWAEVKDVETADISVNGNVEEWNSMDADGWMRRMRTGIDMTIAFSGKRNFTNVGNDYIAGLALLLNTSVNTQVRITTSGAGGSVVYTIPCVIDVSAMLGGDSTAVGILEWTAMSSGVVTAV